MIFNQFYYLVKPYIPWGLRIGIRRYFALRKLKKVSQIWPIDESASQKPDGWTSWPERKRFAFILTHDVEGPKGLSRVRQLAELEMSLGFRSSFNFIPEGSYEVPRELIDWLIANGFEVGVHDLHHDGKLYSSRANFKEAASRINHYLDKWQSKGFRSGFMYHNLDWIHDLDISYDASTFDTDPFEPQPDGVGTIFPFWVENSGNSNSNPSGEDSYKNSGYVELPYTLPQDSTLFFLLQEPGIDVWRTKLDWIANAEGMALVNTHPDYIYFGNDEPAADEFSVQRYREFLQYASTQYENEYWHATPLQLCQWYKSTLKKETAPGPLLASSSQPNLMESHSLDSYGLKGKRAAVLLYSYYPSDPRPRRAAEAMIDAGMEVDLITLQKDESEPKSELVNGVCVTRVSIQKTREGKLSYLWQYAAFITVCFFKLSLRFPFRKYDIVHVHNMPDVLVFSSLIPRLFGSKVVLDLHDPMPELIQTIFGSSKERAVVRLITWLEKLSTRFAHRVITVNQTCKQIFGTRSCPMEKITVVVNSPDEHIFARREPSVTFQNEPDRPVYIMYHGSLVERNGLGLAIEAIRLAQKKISRPVQLRIYGEKTSFIDDVLALAKERDISDSIKYCGPRNLDGIVEAIDQCDIGVIPNLRNIFTLINSPTRIFEFLSRGTPVIAPNSPGVMEFFEETDLITFELGNAEDLALKIQYTVENPNEVLEKTQKGQKICLHHRWSEERKRFLVDVGQLLGTQQQTVANSEVERQLV